MVIDVEPRLLDAMRPGTLAVARLRNVERAETLDGPLAQAARALMADASLDEAMRQSRAMYRGLGMDPTKTRPSSEALLRRLRRGQPLPRINALVDVCNWCSVEFQVPFGLYDLDALQGSLRLRLGAADEAYPGIRKDVVRLAGRPVLCDAAGPFGNPTSDSARTRVTIRTTRALIVLYAPATLSPSRLAECLDSTSERVRAHVAGAETDRWTA